VVRFGVAVLDGYLEFLAVRSRPNTVAAVAYDLKVFFRARAFADVAVLLAAEPVPVMLARGEHDAMVTTAQLSALHPDPVELPGRGHNACVEAPRQRLPL
jgi:pimeloyl-ACP methyl ester carboxylesterase